MGNEPGRTTSSGAGGSRNKSSRVSPATSSSQPLWFTVRAALGRTLERADGEAELRRFERRPGSTRPIRARTNSVYAVSWPGPAKAQVPVQMSSRPSSRFLGLAVRALAGPARGSSGRCCRRRAACRRLSFAGSSAALARRDRSERERTLCATSSSQPLWFTVRAALGRTLERADGGSTITSRIDCFAT
jgi:hypothetical protein